MQTHTHTHANTGRTNVMLKLKLQQQDYNIRTPLQRAYLSCRFIYLPFCMIRCCCCFGCSIAIQNIHATCPTCVQSVYTRIVCVYVQCCLFDSLYMIINGHIHILCGMYAWVCNACICAYVSVCMCLCATNCFNGMLKYLNKNFFVHGSCCE